MTVLPHPRFFNTPWNRKQEIIKILLNIQLNKLSQLLISFEPVCGVAFIFRTRVLWYALDTVFLSQTVSLEVPPLGDALDLSTND
jgi:hypothetical protein